MVSRHSMLRKARGAFNHNLAVIPRSCSAKKLGQHSSLSELKSRIDSRMHLMLCGAKLTMLQQPLLPAITRASVVYSMTYTWVGGLFIQSIWSLAFGTHFSGRNLRRQKKKIVSLLTLSQTFSWPVVELTGNSYRRKALQSLVHDNKDEYYALTQQQQQELLQEFTDQKETRVSGIHVSIKLKINDITQTLEAVEHEVCTRPQIAIRQY